MKRPGFEAWLLLAVLVFIAIAFLFPGGREHLGDVHDAVRTMTPGLGPESKSGI